MADSLPENYIPIVIYNLICLTCWSSNPGAFAQILANDTCSYFSSSAHNAYKSLGLSWKSQNILSEQQQRIPQSFCG